MWINPLKEYIYLKVGENGANVGGDYFTNGEYTLKIPSAGIDISGDYDITHTDYTVMTLFKQRVISSGYKAKDKTINKSPTGILTAGQNIAFAFYCDENYTSKMFNNLFLKFRGFSDGAYPHRVSCSIGGNNINIFEIEAPNNQDIILNNNVCQSGNLVLPYTDDQLQRNIKGIKFTSETPLVITYGNYSGVDKNFDSYDDMLEVKLFEEAFVNE